MVAKKMIRSTSEVIEISMPTWDQIKEAIDCLDDSIWLEGECDHQLSVIRFHLDPSDPDSWGWILIAIYQGGNTLLRARYEDTECLPSDIAEAAIRNWLEQSPGPTSPSPATGGALKWVW